MLMTIDMFFLRSVITFQFLLKPVLHVNEGECRRNQIFVTEK